VLLKRHVLLGKSVVQGSMVLLFEIAMIQHSVPSLKAMSPVVMVHCATMKRQVTY
jgi:hypothetical protein